MSWFCVETSRGAHDDREDNPLAFLSDLVEDDRCKGAGRGQSA